MKIEEKEQCKKCGEWHDNPNECPQDYFSIYNYAKLKGIDLDDKKKEFIFKVGDIVILKPESASGLYDDNVVKTSWSENYKQIHKKNIQGKIIRANEIKNHYCWGEYAFVEWYNGTKSECIETSWLKKYE